MQLVQIEIGSNGRLRHVLHLPFAGAVALEPTAGLQGRPIGDTMKPVANQIAGHNRAGFAGENQKDSLESVLGIVKVANHTPAHAQHHRPMPLDEHGKCGFIAARQERFQQSAIGKNGRSTQQRRATHMAHQRVESIHRTGRHGVCPPGQCWRPLPIIADSRERASFSRIFHRREGRERRETKDMSLGKKMA